MLTGGNPFGDNANGYCMAQIPFIPCNSKPKIKWQEFQFMYSPIKEPGRFRLETRSPATIALKRKPSRPRSIQPTAMARTDGQWRAEWTYGNDPYPPKG